MNSTSPNAAAAQATDIADNILLGPFLEKLELSFKQIVQNTLGGGLNSSEQIITYELAMGKADLYAAQSLYRYGEKMKAQGASDLEVMLGQIGCAQASFELKTR